MKLLRAKDVLIAPRMKFRDVAFQFRMPAGIPGDINRKWASIVESAVLPAAGATVPALYGLGVLIDATSGQIRLPAAGDTALYGVLARPFPTEGSGSALLGTSVPPTTEGIADLLIKGYMTVLLQNATAAKKAGAVFCRLQNPRQIASSVASKRRRMEPTPSQSLAPISWARRTAMATSKSVSTSKTQGEHHIMKHPRIFTADSLPLLASPAMRRLAFATVCKRSTGRPSMAPARS